MTVEEYLSWYEENYGIKPSERLIEKFKDYNDPAKQIINEQIKSERSVKNGKRNKQNKRTNKNTKKQCR